MDITIDELDTLRNDFERYDSNKDDKVSVEEFTTYLSRFLSDESVKSLLDKHNLDYNPEITWLEFVTVFVNDAVVEEFPKGLVSLKYIESLDTSFRRFDTDKDGKANLTELIQGFGGGLTPEKLAKEIESHRKSDRDNDGELTWNEFFLHKVYELYEAQKQAKV